MSRMLFLLLLAGCADKTITHSESKPDSTTKEQRGQIKPKEPDPFIELSKVAGKGRKFDKDKHKGEKFKTNAVVMFGVRRNTWSEITIETETGQNFLLYHSTHDGYAPDDGERIRCKFDLKPRGASGVPTTFDGTLVWWERRRD